MKKGTQVVVAVFPQCQFCSFEARYDAKTSHGPWAYLCETHYQLYGVGLGVGRGQELVLPYVAVDGDKVNAAPAQQLTYEEWLGQVDRHLAKMTGCPMSHLDFGDFASRDLYDAGETPEHTAREILEDELGYDGEME